MRIFYHLSQYISHKKAGLAYIQCLKNLNHHVFSDVALLDSADFAIIHDDIHNFPAIFKANPAILNKYTVAYTVWENEIFPEECAKKLAGMNEVWTCSSFVEKAMLKHFAHVQVLPHLVQKIPVSLDVLEWAKQRIGCEQGRFSFFSICDAVNPRKNITALIAAFQSVQKLVNISVQLVIKQYRDFLDFSHIPNIVCVNETLSDQQIAALHCVCQAYVGSHRAEGWGLGLSESMSFAKPTIATGYSGNMDFMNSENSFVLPYKLVQIPESATKLLSCFNDKMLWAEVDQMALTKTMAQVALGNVAPALLARASTINKKFGQQEIQAQLAKLLQNMPI